MSNSQTLAIHVQKISEEVSEIKDILDKGFDRMLELSEKFAKLCLDDKEAVIEEQPEPPEPLIPRLNADVPTE